MYSVIILILLIYLCGFTFKFVVSEDKYTDTVYIDLSIDGKYGRILIGLYGNIVPKTVKNFIELCTRPEVWMDLRINEQYERILIGLHGNIAPKTVKNFIDLHTSPKRYKGRKFNRVVKRKLIQGGSVSGGKQFKDENLKLRHDREGTVSMATGSQFVITLSAAPDLDGKNIVFGEAFFGMEYVKQIASLDADANGKPKRDAIITDCGVMNPLH